MVTVDKAIVARLERDGKPFEILVDAELAFELKEGKNVSLQRMLAISQVFADAKKGMKASPTDLERAFETLDVEKIAEMIVKRGEIHLTTELRRKKTEEKRKLVASTISKFAMDPRTKLPHPQERIEYAMEQARVSIDPFKPLDVQMEEVIAKLRPIIPISLEKIKICAKIPAQYSSKAYHTVKEYGIKEEQWLADGSLFVMLEIPAGLKEKVYRTLNALTDGSVEIQEL
ncbi:MAG: ribosome assembly factor SBDS [Candidatus Aenigmarchaeota archaeon]|nr:ribosome assembly factor SBDS [Candidatus Aenigmarchaeota archaeon]